MSRKIFLGKNFHILKNAYKECVIVSTSMKMIREKCSTVFSLNIPLVEKYVERLEFNGIFIYYRGI